MKIPPDTLAFAIQRLREQGEILDLGNGKPYIRFPLNSLYDIVKKAFRDCPSPKLDTGDQDVVNALTALGYSSKEALEASDGLTGTLDERIAQALKKMRMVAT